MITMSTDEGTTPDFDAALAAVLDALDPLDTAQAAEDCTLAELARRLDAVRRAMGVLRSMDNVLELQLTEDMPERRSIIGSLYVEKVKRERKNLRPNASENLADDVGVVVATELATDVGTGDVDEVKRNYMRRAIKVALTEVTYTPSNIRAGAKAKYGLDPEDYWERSSYEAIQMRPTEEPA